MMMMMMMMMMINDDKYRGDYVIKWLYSHVEKM